MSRRRADERAQAWVRVLDGMANGIVRVGSRTPVRGLPVWVTLEVLRGGFATGRAAAGGPLADDERQRADRLGLERNRQALFASWLTNDGLLELNDLLARDAYEISHTENAALLVVAWLVAAGDRATALELLEEIEPYASRLRFAPRVAASGRVRSGQVWRRTAAEARRLLMAKRTPRQVGAEREALGIWLPLTDRFLALWWATRSGVTGGTEIGTVWTPELARTATALVTAYERAAVQHRLCDKYRDPKENLSIMVGLTKARLAGPLTEGQRRRVGSVMAAMVAKRATPDSAALAELRASQARVVAAPLHRDLARVAAERCATLPADRGIDDADAVLGSVTEIEAERFCVPGGTVLPTSVERTVRSAIRCTRCSAGWPTSPPATGSTARAALRAVVGLPAGQWGVTGCCTPDIQLRAGSNPRGVELSWSARG